MRVGIDARLLAGRHTGDRTYWRGLIRGLAALDAPDEFLLYVREPLPRSGEDAIALPANFTERVVGASSGRLWSMAALPRAARRDAVDVAHVQYSVSPLFTGPVATTIHDISFRLFPELFTRRDRILLGLSAPAAVRRACRVIAVSESTRRDILRAYRPVAEKVVTTPLAADSAFRPFDERERDMAREALEREVGITGPFALAVGVLQPRKNLPMLLRAFSAAKRIAGFDHALVVTGKSGWLSRETQSAIAAAGGDAVLTGYVADGMLPLLYNCADALCFPSLYEGFGLPALEALACGCPVLASCSSSLPEVVGDAGLLLDPLRPGAWIDALARVLTDADERARLADAGPAQAAKFDWRRTARLTLDAYRACHNG